MPNIDWEMFDAPFEDNEIEWRIQHVIEDKQLGLAVPYIDNRAIQRRLDKVVGKPNWKNEYSAAPAGGVLCGISIRCEDGDWVTKFDGADNTDYEPTKGGLSDSMKRCAVQWGMGRYLYDVEPIWCPVEKKGKNWKLVSKPSLNAKSRIDDKRETRLDTSASSSEKPAQARGAKVARPFTTIDDLVKWLQQSAIDMKASDAVIETGKASNIAQTLNKHLTEDARHFLLWVCWQFESSKQLSEKQFLALKAWCASPIAQLEAECKLIEAEYAAEVERDLASNG